MCDQTVRLPATTGARLPEPEVPASTPADAPPLPEPRSALALVGVSKRLHITLGSGLGTLAALVVLFVVLSFASSAFFTSGNLLNILDQNADIGILACGLTLVVICANLDFSVAATYGLTSIIVAGLASHVGFGGAIVLALLAGVIIGLVNGVLIVGLGIDSFICTLATGFIVAGLTEVITKGNIVTSGDETLASFGNGTVLSLTDATWVFIVVAIVLGVFLARVPLGQSMYAVGDNQEAARLSGMRVKLIVVCAFAVAGLTAAIGGVLIAARTSAGQPQGDSIWWWPRLRLSSSAEPARAAAQAPYGGRLSACCSLV